MYIEDDTKALQYTTSVLESFASTVLTASNGVEGLQKFNKHAVDLVITDLQMPKLGGMGVIEQLKVLNSEIPIIVLSAYQDIETLHKVIDFGIQGYIVKPIDMKKLSDRINNVKKKHEENYINNKDRIKPNTNNFLDYGQHKLIEYLDSIETSTVILIKIEEFKYLNNSITSKISKKLQKRFAKKLLMLMTSKCNFTKIYILENGEFVFSKPYDETNSYDELEREVKEFQSRVNKAKIKIGLVDYTLSIIVSLAYGKNALENAKVGISNLLETKQDFIVANKLRIEEKSRALKKLETFKMLKDAIRTYNIISYFQPIVNNKTQKIEKYESLVRLIDENNNTISPYFFLETAKEGKYYHEITSMVLRNSFRALFETEIGISINLSALDIEKKQTRAEFFLLLEEYKTETHRITVELVEDETIVNIEVVKDFMQKIKSLGVQIAIDDFGTGLSNFARVLAYQPDYIKIDGILIKNIANNTFSRNMVETIVDFAQKQNIKTIAEYVENESIYNILCDVGVDYSQGYYFGKPKVLKKEII